MYVKASVKVLKKKIGPVYLDIFQIPPNSRIFQAMFRMFTDIRLAFQANKSSSLFRFSWWKGKETLTWCVETIFPGAERVFVSKPRNHKSKPVSI